VRFSEYNDWPADTRRPGRIVNQAMPHHLEEELMNTRYLAASVLAAAVAAPVVMLAQKPVPAPTAFKTEKCYGIAKAGKNDCASTGNNSCGGSSKLNSDPKAWIYVPAGYCERIVGGSLQPK
jgi:uncharacterized membrane protein